MLQIVEAETLEDIGAIPFASKESVYSISWGPNDEIAVAASDLMEVGVIEPDGTPRSFGARPGRDFYSVGFSPAGQLAVAKGSTVLIYEF